MSLKQEHPREDDGPAIATELAGRLRQQAAVAQLGQRALADADLAALMADAVALVASTLGVEYVKILERLPGGEVLLLRAGVGWKPGYVGQATVFAGLGSQAGFTLLSHEPVIVEDLRTERRFSGPPLLVEHGVVSGLSVTIPGRDAPFGVLGAHTVSQRTFTGDDINFLQSVANVVALAIDRARSVEAIRQNEERMRAILEAAAEGVVIVNAAGRIEFVNAKTETMFGYDRLELMGERLEILLPERFRDAHVAHRTGYFAAPRARPMGLGLELSGRRKDGSEFPVEISLSFARTEAVAVGFITDVTTRRALERAARQAEKLASLGTLAAGLAHEFNNPIGIISSRTELMLLEAESRALPEDVREDLSVLHRHAQRVSRIAHGLLSFARQSTGQPASVELNRLVEETLLLIENQLTKEGIVVRRRLTSALPPLWGDANALQHVFLNLLTNARDALRGRGEITIETSLAADGGVRLIVRDTGCGIAPDVLPRIFDPFYTTKSEGSGLGLSISYGIVRDHQGTIDVQSTPGQGTTFVLTFPAGPPGSDA
jgi:two-component system, cell cycle sensor histidine kinase and response regulator CckA